MINEQDETLEEIKKYLQNLFRNRDSNIELETICPDAKFASEMNPNLDDKISTYELVMTPKKYFGVS